MKQTKTPLLINPRYKTKKIHGGSYVFNPDSINNPAEWGKAILGTVPKLVGFLI